MARKSYLMRRQGRWSYNRAYPKDVWPVVGRAPFRLALGTDSMEEAQRRRGAAEQRYWAAVDEARKKLGEDRPRALSDVEAVAIVSRWFVRRNAELDHSHLHQPTPAEGWQDAVSENEYGIHYAAERLKMSDVEAFAPLAARVLAAEGVNADTASQGYRTLLQLLVRANKELAAIDLARLQGDFGYRPMDPVMREALGAAPAPKRTVDDLIATYEADRGGRWAPSTRDAYQPVWRLLRDCLGAKRDVASITRDDGRMLYETVKALPSGLGKLKVLKGLSVTHAVSKAKTLGLATISPKTINGSYMGLLASAFEWAVKEQWLTANPVSGLTVADDVDAADKRDPFTLDQLKVIFNGAPWAPRESSPRGKPLHFWGPLIALFHGMRRGEIAQLQVADIETVDGIVVIQVRAGSDGQRVKTRAGRRTLPVHLELQRIGFLAFVEERRRTGERQLFPDEAPNIRGQWGDGFSDWFLRLLDKRAVTGRKLGMHSFRHNFEDRLRAAGLRGTDIGKELAGRSKGADVGDKYGSGYAASQLAEAVNRITYPELDLSALYVAQYG